MELFSHPETWGALITLTFLEIILGIDNIIFISITAGKLPENKIKKATNIGLLLAMVFRILLLTGVTYLIAMKDPLFYVNWSWLKASISGQSLILFAGGIFLLYKSTHEIHAKVEGKDITTQTKNTQGVSMLSVIVQIVLIDIVFSFDSVLTAVGMTNGIHGALVIMITAVIISIIIMMIFARPIGKFVNTHPTIQMLALSFLILIGFMLVTESAHLSHAIVFGQEVGAIPKGYLYFAITFSLGVEVLNMKMRSKTNKI
ncbi:TerC family protein [Namhaeicola litoreus]|uniref:TerC family protein n=1 Tax=Namhaeicola litoreus TaxID=1052145 RepID=A0ABW3Y577_9FLAO